MKVVTTIRIDKELLEYMQELAKDEQRSVNYYIDKAIKEYLGVTEDDYVKSNTRKSDKS